MKSKSHAERMLSAMNPDGMRICYQVAEEAQKLLRGDDEIEENIPLFKNGRR